MTHTIDLKFQGQAKSIAAYVVEHATGVLVVDPGPATCSAAFDAGLAALGYSLSDVTDCLLTHIHFDHAGAAWRLAEAGATVHVHPAGYKHLLNPERLWGSAARIYSEEGMERLWGTMAPVAEGRLRQWNDRETATVGGLRLLALHTPGHAKHHIAWRIGDEVFLGDVGGCRIGAGPVEPPCPPPDIDLSLWRVSLAELRKLEGVSAGYRTHYGRIEGADLAAAYDAVEEGLIRWLGYVTQVDHTSEAGRVTAFVNAVAAERAPYGEDVAHSYALANPAAMSVTGLLRYLAKREGETS